MSSSSSTNQPLPPLHNVWYPPVSTVVQTRHSDDGFLIKAKLFTNRMPDTANNALGDGFLRFQFFNPLTGCNTAINIMGPATFARRSKIWEGPVNEMDQLFGIVIDERSQVSLSFRPEGPPEERRLDSGSDGVWKTQSYLPIKGTSANRYTPSRDSQFEVQVEQTKVPPGLTGAEWPTMSPSQAIRFGIFGCGTAAQPGGEWPMTFYERYSLPPSMVSYQSSIRSCCTARLSLTGLQQGSSPTAVMSSSHSIAAGDTSVSNSRSSSKRPLRQWLGSRRHKDEG